MSPHQYDYHVLAFDARHNDMIRIYAAGMMQRLFRTHMPWPFLQNQPHELIEGLDILLPQPSLHSCRLCPHYIRSMVVANMSGVFWIAYV
jgi:hypothetical protein